MKIVYSRRSVICLAAIAAMATLITVAYTTLQHHESSLAIQAPNQSASMPDGFSLLHQLHANGIMFKSITPQDDKLLIKFSTNAERDAARQVLYRTLPQGLIIAQEEEKSPTPQWLQRLHVDANHAG